MTILQEGYLQDSCIRSSPKLNAILPGRTNPLDCFERISIAEHYDYERLDGSELNISLPGRCGYHDLSLRWHADKEQVQIFLVLESRSPMGRTDRLCRLMSLLNERLSAGHFDYWERNSSLVYRHNLSLRGAAKISLEQAMDIISAARDAAECGFPACQYVIWAGKTPEEALDQAFAETTIGVI